MLLYLCQCRPTPANTLPTLSFPLIEPFPLLNPCLKPILKEISMKQKKFRVETDLTCIDHVACVFIPGSAKLARKGQHVPCLFERRSTTAKIVLLFHCICNSTTILERRETHLNGQNRNRNPSYVPVVVLSPIWLFLHT
ncbi:hypothetical protein L208DRAFT_1397345 [Tricholoma matsutake]|nr:hypothetical protein L208DRAFT_1397345 [Tricholoma matsutake 945]